MKLNETVKVDFDWIGIDSIGNNKNLRSTLSNDSYSYSIMVQIEVDILYFTYRRYSDYKACKATHMI